MGLNSKIASLFCIFAALCLAYLCFTAVMLKNTIGVAVAVIFICLVLVICFCFYAIVRKYMQDVFSRLSEVIASIIDMNEIEVFSTVEDNMLSRLQSQIMKLSGILKMQNLQLEKEKNEIKSLVSDIAHQLKNPLSNLNLYVSFLKESGIDEESRQEYVQNTCIQLEKLSWLMESMIKMSRLECGIIQLKPELCSVDDIILTSIKQVYLKADKKDIRIIYESSADTALLLDKKWTAEALTNILDNSVKYTDEKGIVKITVQKYEMYIRVDVEDNGTGLNDTEINNIFKRFYRGGNAKNSDGVGIGLYLAREIVTKQDGYIKVKSQLGVGSVFSVFLLMRRN